MKLIGSVPDSDDWYPELPAEPSETIRADMEIMRGMVQMPEEWLRYCTLYGPGSRNGDDPVVLLNVGGHMGPPRSEEDLLLAVNAGVGLFLDLQDGFDLWDIADVIGSVVWLSVGGRGIRGWSALEHAKHVTRLVVGSPSEPLHLASLPRLTSFYGHGPNSVWAAANPNLEDLHLDSPTWPSKVRVEGPLRYFQIQDARRITQMPPFTHPEALRTLRVNSAREFDLASLTPFRNVESVEIAPCARLSNVSALLDLPALADVEFGGVKEMDFRPLLQLDVRRLYIGNNQAIPNTFIERLATVHPSYRITPMKSGLDHKARNAFAFDEVGIDGSTFAPLTMTDQSDPDYVYSLALNPEDVDPDPEHSALVIEQIMDEVQLVRADALTSGEVSPFQFETDFVLQFASLALLEQVALRLHERFFAGTDK